MYVYHCNKVINEFVLNCTFTLLLVIVIKQSVTNQLQPAINDIQNHIEMHTYASVSHKMHLSRQIK